MFSKKLAFEGIKGLVEEENPLTVGGVGGLCGQLHSEGAHDVVGGGIGHCVKCGDGLAVLTAHSYSFGHKVHCSRHSAEAQVGNRVLARGVVAHAEGELHGCAVEPNLGGLVDILRRFGLGELHIGCSVMGSRVPSITE